MKHLFTLLLSFTLIFSLATIAWAEDTNSIPEPEAIASMQLPYADTDHLNDSQKLALSSLYDLEIFNGSLIDGQLLFRAEASISRAEFSKAVWVLSDLKLKDNLTNNFSDITANYWATPYILNAVDQQWFFGYDDNTFKPQNNISFEEVITVIMRIAYPELEASLADDDNGYTPYLNAAIEYGIITEETVELNQNQDASRLIVAEIIYSLLQKQKAPISGMVISYDDQGLSLISANGNQHDFEPSSILPADLMIGSYLELTTDQGQISGISQAVSPEKDTVYAHIDAAAQTITLQSDDDGSGEFSGTEYDISKAQIYIANYGINQAYSNDSFDGQRIADANIFNADGILIAEMWQIIAADQEQINALYLVNPSIRYTGLYFASVNGLGNDGDGSHYLLNDGESTAPADDLSLEIPTYDNAGDVNGSKAVTDNLIIAYTLDADGISEYYPLIFKDGAEVLLNFDQAAFLGDSDDNYQVLELDNKQLQLVDKFTTGTTTNQNFYPLADFDSSNDFVHIIEDDTDPDNPSIKRFGMADDCQIYHVKDGIEPIDSGDLKDLLADNDGNSRVNGLFKDGEIVVLFYAISSVI